MVGIDIRAQPGGIGRKQRIGDKLLPRYIERIRRALSLTVEGIRKASDPAAGERLTYYETALREVVEMERQL